MLDCFAIGGFKTDAVTADRLVILVRGKECAPAADKLRRAVHDDIFAFQAVVHAGREGQVIGNIPSQLGVAFGFRAGDFKNGFLIHAILHGEIGGVGGF